MLRADVKSPQYNEAERESMFYAQSCLLVHMLMLGEGYADKFPRFLERVSATGSSQTAFIEVYEKSTADIERQMTRVLPPTGAKRAPAFGPFLRSSKSAKPALPQRSRWELRWRG